jgi:hypothetical protein
MRQKCDNVQLLIDIESKPLGSYDCIDASRRQNRQNSGTGVPTQGTEKATGLGLTWPPVGRKNLRPMVGANRIKRQINGAILRHNQD